MKKHSSLFYIFYFFGRKSVI